MTTATEVDASGLTIEDLAYVFQAEGELPKATLRRLAWWLLTDPRLADPLARLARMAADAGHVDFWLGYWYNQELDRLLEDDDWTHPSEILDPAGDGVDIGYRELLSIAAARAARAPASERARLRAVAKKLEAAAAGEG